MSRADDMANLTPALSTADLCDAFPDEVEVCRVEWRSLGGRRSFGGEIETVSVFEDAGLVKRALAEPGRGRVLVVDGGGSNRVAILGDRLAGIAVQNGWAGIVVLGAVRDTEGLARLNVGVVATAVSPARASLAGHGRIGATFEIGGATFARGRTVICDMDGIVVR